MASSGPPSAFIRAGERRIGRVPSIELEDAKRLHRERRRLIAERVQHVNRIKGLCATKPTRRGR
jgi:transposase